MSILKLRVFMLFAAISGCCGLGYEILYMRLFSNYFGDAFIISSALLSAVFLGIAFGSYFSHRFIGYLGLIEIIIGLYSMILATLLSWQGFNIVSFMGASEIANAIKLYILLLPPIFLIGTCIPLFSEYCRLSSISQNLTDVFPKIYSLYNLGAVSSIIVIEFYILRQWGLLNAFYLLAFLNFLVGGCIFWTIDFAKFQKQNQLKTIDIKKGKYAFDLLIFVLFVMSFASGMYQLLLLKLVASIFGPLKENFAIVLISAIMGVAVGAFLFKVFKPSIEWIISIGVVFYLLEFLGLQTFIYYWSSVVSSEINVQYIQIIKISLILLISLPVYSVLGMLVPSILYEKNNKSPLELNNTSSGFVLCVSALANGLGTISFMVFFYQILPSVGLVVLIGVILLIAAFIVMLHKKLHSIKMLALSFICLILGSVTINMWPGTELLFGFRIIENNELLSEKLNNYSHAEIYKSGNQNAALVFEKTGEFSLVFNGYQSLFFGAITRSELHEALVGSSSGLFSNDTKSALVFGLGSGISAGASAKIFDQVDIVEINPAIFHIPPHFEEENFHLLKAENVKIKLEDGISTLVTDPKKYDAIINTVTSPKYYSAVKMYTSDFYEIVSRSLKKGGVYSSWFDLNVGQRGLSIMLNTLESSFAKCRYFILDSGYFNAICGNKNYNLLPQRETSSRFSSESLTNVMAKYGLNLSVREFFKALEIDFGRDFFPRNSTKINTLNQPYIEFDSSSFGFDENFQLILYEVIEKNLAIRKLLNKNDQKLASKCKVVEIMVRVNFKNCAS